MISVQIKINNLHRLGLEQQNFAGLIEGKLVRSHLESAPFKQSLFY